VHAQTPPAEVEVAIARRRELALSEPMRKMSFRATRSRSSGCAAMIAATSSVENSSRSMSRSRGEWIGTTGIDPRPGALPHARERGALRSGLRRPGRRLSRRPRDVRGGYRRWGDATLVSLKRLLDAPPRPHRSL
jgi:hypothetical protein